MNDHLGYTNEDMKKVVEELRYLREATLQERTENSILLNKVLSTLQEKLQKIGLLITQLLAKTPNISQQDFTIILDTLKDLRYRFRLVPLSITRNSDDYITQIKYEFLDEVITLDIKRDSNNYITDKSVKIERE